MSEIRNLEVMRAYHEHWNNADADGVLSMFAEDSRNHGKPLGRAGLEPTIRDIFTMFPDIQINVIEIVAKDDQVIVRCRYSGTHQGTGATSVYGGYLQRIRPTGRYFDVQQTHWMTLCDGQIVEHQSNRDDLGMMVQLGLLPKSSSQVPKHV